MSKPSGFKPGDRMVVLVPEHIFHTATADADGRRALIGLFDGDSQEMLDRWDYVIDRPVKPGDLLVLELVEQYRHEYTLGAYPPVYWHIWKVVEEDE